MSTGNPGGDSLARGARSASWGSIPVSQEKWDSIFEDMPSEYDAHAAQKPLKENTSFCGFHYTTDFNNSTDPVKWTKWFEMFPPPQPGQVEESLPNSSPTIYCTGNSCEFVHKRRGKKKSKRTAKTK